MTRLCIDLPAQESQRFRELLQELAQSEGIDLMARPLSPEEEQPRH